MGYSLWGGKVTDMTERLTLYLSLSGCWWGQCGGQKPGLSGGSLLTGVEMEKGEAVWLLDWPGWAYGMWGLQGCCLVMAAVYREGPWGTGGPVTRVWRRDWAGSGGGQGSGHGWKGGHCQPACPAEGTHGVFLIQTEVKAGKRLGGLSQEVWGCWAGWWAVQIPTGDSGCAANLGLLDLAM